MYEIHSSSDFQKGVTLIVKIPESDLDQKALYTISSDKPDFILPFNHKTVDGQVEFTLLDSDIYRNLFIITKQNSTPAKYPRKAGLPSKEPLS